MTFCGITTFILIFIAIVFIYSAITYNIKCTNETHGAIAKLRMFRGFAEYCRDHKHDLPVNIKVQFDRLEKDLKATQRG